MLSRWCVAVLLIALAVVVAKARASNSLSFPSDASVDAWVDRELDSLSVNGSVRIHTERRRLSADESLDLQSVFRPPRRREKFHKILDVAQHAPPLPFPLDHHSQSVPIASQRQAIVSVALSESYYHKDATNFAGTARRAGYTGDIVVVVLPTAREDFLQALAHYNVSVWTATRASCSGRTDVRCRLDGTESAEYPVTLARFLLYQRVLAQYPAHALVMLADFRDVFFQSNPFRSKHTLLLGERENENQIVMSAEHHPNRVLNRCAQHIYLVRTCYGDDMLRRIGTNAIVSSGVVIGSRNALFAYSYLITAQMNPSLRRIYNVTSDPYIDDTKCLHFGVDQGFHNVLFYTGIFSKFFDIRLFPQGEGPVNIVGGFHGEKKLLRAYLAEWKVLRGEAPYKYIYNWNGEISPVVHQLERFLPTELEGGYVAHMAAFKHLNPFVPKKKDQ